MKIFQRSRKAGPQDPSQQVNGSHQLKILLAEDNSFDVDCMKDALQDLRLPHELTIADNGETAREYLLNAGSRFDLVLLDVHLPRLSGLQVLHDVPGFERLPVCLVTGTPIDRSRLKRLFRIQKLNCIAKPVDSNKLRACLRAFTHLRRIVDALEAS